MELEEAIEGLETDIYNLTNFLTDSEKEIWQKAIDTIINYIKEESISKAVVEEKIKVVQERIKEETRIDFLITLKILENELQEILNKGE